MSMRRRANPLFGLLNPYRESKSVCNCFIVNFESNGKITCQILNYMQKVRASENYMFKNNGSDSW